MMHWQYTPYILPVIIAAVISTALAVYVGRRRSAPGAVAFVVLTVAVAEWVLGYALELAGADLPTKIVWAKAQYLGIVTVPLAWLAFALYYTGRKSWLDRNWLVAAPLALLPLITLLLVWTNDAHHLIWQRISLDTAGPFLALDVAYGPWFWIHSAYSYLMLLLGTIWLIARFLRSPNLYRHQAGVLLVGVLAPWAGNALYLSGLSPIPNLDLTPFAFVLSGLALAWGLYRFRLLQIVPVARRAVVDGMADGVLVLNQQNRIVDFNPAAERIFGFPAATAIGRSAEVVFADCPHLLERYRDVLEMHAEIALPVRSRQGAADPGQGLGYYDLHISPLSDEDGQIIGRLVMLHDITARKQAEQAQRRIADRQTTLYEVLRAVAEHAAPNHVAQVAVKAIDQFAGWSNVVIAMPDEEGRHWIARAVGGRRSALDGLKLPIDEGLIGRAFSTGQTQSVPDVRANPDYIDRDPEVRSALAVPLRRAGRTLGVLSLESRRPAAFDADDVLLAESLAETVALALDNARLFERVVDERSRLQALIESSRDGIILIGADLRVLVTNAPALSFLRLPGQPEEWTGRPIQDALELLRNYAPEVVQAALTEMKRVQGGDGLPAEGEYQVLSRTISWQNLPVLAGTTPLGRLLVLRDVTDERMVEKMRDDLTHTMVHDLRNPLTAVFNALHLFRGDLAANLTTDQHHLLDIARNSSQRTLRLVNNILDVSRLEEGKMPMDREPVSMAELVAETVEAQSLLAADKNLSLESDVSASLPLAWADARLIERVLQNLVGNAIKFTPEGGQIRITASRGWTPPPEQEGKRAPGTPQISLAVSDTGPGMPPELESRLFQKFVTGDEPGAGSGLGLIFCKLAVEAHGGRIWVDSEPGQGTTFVFTLPTVEESDSTSSDQLESEQSLSF